ncbi:recombinase family protein [Romboutsia sp. 1001216sp1]|uniref:recombinase family protein n=2 Tax=Clostridia TaxID=186801 RepID=UPI00232B70D1|nr:recombinase family protein [Romboutsia sp. 1001216sp1]MDB8791076.1 recombinase family protein [Romboutsia sp. 1001216sp1]
MKELLVEQEKNNKIYGYARCSTNETKQDIQRQVRELKELGATDKTIYTEYESGAKRDRIELNRLLEVIQNGDTLVTTEVSRISRSMKDLIEILDILKDKMVKVILGSFTLDFRNGDVDPMVKAMVNMLGVFGEMERDITSSRVKSGLENAKANGKKLGRPNTTIDNIPNIFLKYYPRYKSKKINKAELAKLCKMSRTTIYKYIRLLE